MKKISSIFASVALLGLVGCGSTTDEETSGKNLGIADNEICSDIAQDVNWNKVLLADAEKLSEYQLFQSQCNPTANPNSRGLVYDLTVPLFTDYASKYRFVFVPEDNKASYVENEVFDFPIGSVITKTFSMPTDSSNRTADAEYLYETRLLIKKATGWVARVYKWDDNGLDATRVREGSKIETSLVHKSSTMNFDYGVPTQAECTTCHQYNPGGNKDIVEDFNDNGILDQNEEEVAGAFFSPIGPKARYLNSNYDYGQGPENQIEKWIAEGLLDSTTVPSAELRETSPSFDDNVDIENIPTDELEDVAKAWLDINCAHCHRVEGSASNTAFKSDTSSDFQGLCEVPVSGAGTGALVVLPGGSEGSLIYQRLVSTDPGFAMPALGRTTMHQEGTALIKRWIDNMTGPVCN